MPKKTVKVSSNLPCHSFSEDRIQDPGHLLSGVFIQKVSGSRIVNLLLS